MTRPSNRINISFWQPCCQQLFSADSLLDDDPPDRANGLPNLGRAGDGGKLALLL